MINGWFVLNEDKTPRLCDFEEYYAMWRDFDNRCVVGRTDVAGVHVSTVFLGSDHNWGEGESLLFETMLFCDGPMDNAMDRYHTWAEAARGHEAAVRALRDGKTLEWF